MNQTENDLAELCRLQSDEIVRLRALCREALLVCKECADRPGIPDRMLDPLRKAVNDDSQE